ncbi:MAG: hypothetical protein KDK78_11905 [Chlamydiia bacterium]|nr:hypothetical protein [Chlamydiia bacterium]
MAQRLIPALSLFLSSFFASALLAGPSFDCEYCALNNQDYLSFQTETEAFTVVRLGAGALSSVDASVPMTPYVGLARRYEKGGSAVEISACWAAPEMDRVNDSYYYAIPRIMYLLYAQPHDRSCFFYGAGLSWGKVVDAVEDRKFTGIFGDVSLGYEMQRDSSVRAIVQLDIAQPFIASKMRGDQPPATVMLTMGVGF